MQKVYLSVLYGSENTPPILLVFVSFIVLAILLFIFVIFPLFTGTIRTFYNAIQPDERLKFTDIFKTFTGARWLNAVKLGAMVTILIILTAILNFLINRGFSSLIESVLFPMLGSDIDEKLFRIVATILLLIISFLSSIVAWFVTILVTNMAVIFVENSQHKFKEIIKSSWRGIFNKQKTFLLFFITLLILNFILLLTSFAVSEVIQNYISAFSSSELKIIQAISAILFFFMRFFIYFFMIGTIVQYMVKRGKKEATN
ncbi:hypothetical protein [Staphylococcus ratti]|uniref:Lytic regulatory protein n=1 Tax=Staphylococcus ratti TaxID=2892440 RepID=A0ABY3PED1_9STAP|nr:hypothetical protein [Staphylococcus ratti]UEX90653.1 hypothetical protein LN051_03060 [Staphylococcus ratti]